MGQPPSSKKIVLVALAAVVLMNALLFFILPDTISLQINANWDVHGSNIPKILFVFIAPLVLIGSYVYANLSPTNEKQALILAGIAFVGNIVTIAFNMIATAG